jgi:hypothetical protein
METIRLQPYSLNELTISGFEYSWYPTVNEPENFIHGIINLDLQILLHPDLSGRFLTDSSSQTLFLRHQM